LYVAAWILRAAKRRHSGNTGNARLKMQDDMAELLLMLGLAVEPNAPETAGGRRLRPDRWRFARTERRVAMRALGWRSRLGAGRRSPGPRSGGE
jgi:hypothetical protein